MKASAAPRRASSPSVWLQQAWRSRGALACALWPLAALFGGLAGARRLAYRAGWLQAQKLPVPVIVVGNLVAGGAGKTPTTIAVVALLQRHGHAPGIISRGYRGGGDGRGDAPPLEVHAAMAATQCGDEPLLMHRRSGVPVVVARDRVAAGRALLHRHPEIDVIVSDDGLQHLRLARDAQVLVFDERGAGNGWLLPAGPLREPLPSAVPARSLVLYNAPAATTALPGQRVQRTLAGAVPLAQWHAGQAPDPTQLTALRGRPLLAVAGLAQPQRFFAMLRDAGLAITPLALPDHHDYAALPWAAGTPDVVLTEKDAVKLDPARLGSTRVWVVALDFKLPAEFEAALLALLPPRAASQPGTDHANPSS